MVCKDQKRPENPYGDTGAKAVSDDPNWRLKMQIYDEAQQDMLKAGFVRIVKEE